MAYGEMYRTNRTGWGLGSRYGTEYRTGNFYNNRTARGGIGYGRDFNAGYTGTPRARYGTEFTGATDRGFYGRDYQGYGAAYYKSDYETDFGDPFGDRQRGTPIRMMRGEWEDNFGYGRDYRANRNVGYDRDYLGTSRTVGYDYDRDYTVRNRELDLNYGRDYGTNWGRRPTGWRY